MPSTIWAFLQLRARRPSRYLLAGGLLTLLAIDPSPTLAQQIELQIRSAAPDDDYLTWAPAPARIRQTAAAADKRVVLTNDPERPVPAGRKLPLDGNVAFAKSVAPGATATEPTLELVLPKDGTWVDFIVAGSFPRASTEDKDAVIEVHDGTASGPLLHQHAAMVRIRKDHRDLTDQERLRFLGALSRFLRQDPNKGYERLVRIHELAAMGKYQTPPDYFWPDLAHRGPGFLAWHRAYLLNFERELQKINPAVALPYWKMELLASVFNENFMGANTVSSDAFVEPTFAANNPLAHWVVNGEPLYRFPYQRNDAQDLKSRFFSDDTLFIETAYARFSRKLEGNPHNLGHNWTGPWMQNCMISPSDPVFWPFHTGFDRQWATWQWSGGRLQPDGSRESYFPNDAYDDAATGCNVSSPNSCVPVGHHLKDTMWPWNSKTGPGATIKGNRPPADLSQGFMGPFPKASIDGLWPAQPAIPTPADVIDYAGITPQRLDMGFAYDNVPFGVKPQLEIVMATPSSAGTGGAGSESPQADREVVEARAIATDKTRPDAQRIEALQTLSPLPDNTVMPAAIAILDEAGRSAALGAAAVEALSLQMMFGDFDHATHHTALAALHKALADKDLAVRQAALRVLASHRDPELVGKLVSSLDNAADTSFAPVDAIRGLAVAGAAQKYASSIRKHLSAGAANIRAAAIVALASDAASRPAIAAILADRNQPESVRSAAIRSLTAGTSEATDPLLNVLNNPQEPRNLREQAAGALATTVETHGAALDKTRLNGIAAELRKLETPLAAAAARALQATDALKEKK
jgi:hypothetical protein